MACAAPLRHLPAIPTAPPDPFRCCEAVRCRMLVSRRAEVGDAGLRRLLQMQTRQLVELDNPALDNSITATTPLSASGAHALRPPKPARR